MSDDLDTPQIASADDLLEGDELESEPYTLANGKTVLLRPMSREDAIRVHDAKGVKAREVVMITSSMVEPKLTAQQVKDWMLKGKADVIGLLTEEIARRSGLEEEAEDQAVREFP